MYANVEIQSVSRDDFTALYKAYHHRVFRLCLYLLGSKEAAEDATQEAFLRVRGKLETYDASMPFSSWLLTIATNHCLDLLRRRGLETRLFEQKPVEEFHPSARGPSPLTELLAAERGDSVRRALMTLPHRLRIPLVLAYYNELSYDEIARTLGLKRTHVATLLFRAKQELRRKLALGGAK
jgi:RNA polymerase sigma-70 factor, ECF subfamily